MFTQKNVLPTIALVFTFSNVTIAQVPLPFASERHTFFRSSETTEDEIETDRDSFTPATSVVGIGNFVFESAYSFIDNRSVPETHSLPEVICRYGITKNLELRFGYNYEIGGVGSPITGNAPEHGVGATELERESIILYGTKVWMTEQDEWLPSSSILVQGHTPVQGENTRTNLSVSHVVGWQLNNNWRWDSAIRYGTGSFEEDRFNTWSPSTVIKIPVGEKWKIHAEYFSVSTAGRETETTQHFFSPGGHYLITPNLEVGVRVGWGLNEQAPNFFSNLGCGLRF